MHDANKVLLGTTPSSVRDVTREDADPASFPAGVAVRRSSTGGLVIADDSTAALIGISAGPDLSNAKKTAVIRTGRMIPLRLKEKATLTLDGAIVIEAVAAGPAGEEVTIVVEDGGSIDVSVDGKVITVGVDAGTSPADDVTAAINLAAADLVTATLVNGQDATTITAKDATPLAAPSYPAKGKAVEIDDVTGEAVESGDATGGVYASGVLTGVYPDGTTVYVALVDALGGL